MALLLAMFMAVLGAAGIWEHTLFGWAAALAPWISPLSQLLGLLLWSGAILTYAFPDGRFTPGWTKVLAVVLVPIAASLAFNLPIFLNTDTWPAPLPLLPHIVFLGAALFSVIYRYTRTLDPGRKAQLAPYVLGISVLVVMHFILLAWSDAYPMLTGQDLLQTMRANLLFVLLTEPLWFALELFFAAAVSISVFRRGLMQP